MNTALQRVTAVAAVTGGIVALTAGLTPVAAAPTNTYIVGNGQTLTYEGPFAVVFADTLLQNLGTMNFTNAGAVAFIDGSVLENEGTFSLSGSATAIFVSGTAAFNSGTYTQSGGVTTIEGGSTFTNDAGFAQTGGTVLIDAGATFDGTGGVALGGGAMTVNGQLIQTGVTVNGGTLQGTGTIQSNVNNAGGTVGPGNSPGTLTVDGDFTQGPGGTLAIEIDSLASFDLLDVLGAAELGGTLDLLVDAGYAASAQLGDSFTIMNWESVSGTFATVNGLDLGDGRFFTLDYGTSGLTLTVATETAAIAEPGMLALLGIGLAGIAFARRRRR